MRRMLLPWIFVCFLCLIGISASRAQRPIRPVRPVLTDDLPQLVWNAAERGPLLIVAPDTTFAPYLSPGVQPDPPPPGGYRPNVLA